jgi:hypothetical protein
LGHALLLLQSLGFDFYSTTLLAQFPNFAKKILHGDESVFILLLSIFSLGIGIGSLMCEKLSKGKVELGLVLFGASGLTIFGVDLYYASANIYESLSNKAFFDYAAFIAKQYDAEGHLILSHWRLIADIAFIGIFGGLYIVPLYAFIQTRAEKSHQSRVIAANNILNALFMVISALFSVYVFNMGLNIPELFLVTALLSVIVMAYLCIRQPAYLRSFIAWLKPNP